MSTNLNVTMGSVSKPTGSVMAITTVEMEVMKVIAVRRKVMLFIRIGITLLYSPTPNLIVYNR